MVQLKTQKNLAKREKCKTCQNHSTMTQIVLISERLHLFRKLLHFFCNSRHWSYPVYWATVINEIRVKIKYSYHVNWLSAHVCHIAENCDVWSNFLRKYVISHILALKREICLVEKSECELRMAVSTPRLFHKRHHRQRGVCQGNGGILDPFYLWD